MTPKKVIILIALLLFSVCLLITGYMDDDWRTVTYYFNSIQNTWDYWEYCPYIRVNWWLAYAIDTVKVAVGWSLFWPTLTYIGLVLTGKIKD